MFEEERRRVSDQELLALQDIQHDLHDLKEAVNSHVKTEGAHLSDEERSIRKKHHEYLEIVLEREAKKAKLIDAIIEKTLVSLLASLVMFIVFAVWKTLTGK